MDSVLECEVKSLALWVALEQVTRDMTHLENKRDVLVAQLHACDARKNEIIQIRKGNKDTCTLGVNT